MATANGLILTGNAVVTYGMATVIIDGLACGVTYNIITGGTLNGDLIGPRSSHGTTTTGPCPPMIITNTTDTASMTGTPAAADDSNNSTGAIVGGVVGAICGLVLLILIIILLWWCGIRNRGKSNNPRNAPVAVSNVPVYDTIEDPVVSNQVKMEPNPAYQGLPSDRVKMETNPAYKGLTFDQVKVEPNPAHQLVASNQANKGPDPAYQYLSSYTGRASASKQKPAGNVNDYIEIVNEQNITMTKNSSASVPYY